MPSGSGSTGLFRTDTGHELPYVDVGGVPRVLAALPPRPDFGGFARFAAANPIVPRSEWREVDLTTWAVPVLNQGAHGSCVGHGSTSAFWLASLLAGNTVPAGGFSPTSLYALINGGRDAGAIVSDAMDALISAGVCLMADVPESIIYKRQISAEAEAKRSRFRASVAYHCATFDAIGSAVQLGFPASFGVVLPGNFQGGLDAGGVAGLGRGVLGGHCMAAFGLRKVAAGPHAGKWAVLVRNSWGESWGDRGNCLMVEDHFTYQQGEVDAFAVQATQLDPQDPYQPPVVGPG